MPEAASPRALCSKTDVLAWMPSFTSTETFDEDLVQRLINSESDDFHEYTHREIKPESTNAATRTFDVDEDTLEERELLIGEAASIVTVTIKDSDGITVAAAPSYVAMPRNRKSWEPITTLWFRRDVAAPATLARGYTIDVDGVWGWPLVPERIRQAATVLAGAAYLSDAARGSDLEELDPDTAASFRRAVRVALDTRDSLRVPGVF